MTTDFEVAAPGSQALLKAALIALPQCYCPNQGIRHEGHDRQWTVRQCVEAGLCTCDCRRALAGDAPCRT